MSKVLYVLYYILHIMSLATLKKKTGSKYKSMSVNAGGFSLNGTHRNQGYVGQTTQGRYLPGGKMLGPDIKGSGTCCGKYVNMPPESQLIGCMTEDPNVVKKSSLNNSGLLMTHYRWIRRGIPYTSIKSNHNMATSQSAYLDTVSKEHAVLIQEINQNELCRQPEPPAECKNPCIGEKQTNDKIAHYTRSGSQYIARLTTCNEFINPRPNPRPTFGMPSACKTVVPITTA